MDSQLPTPADIRSEANAFQKSRIILTAFELDIFTILEAKLLTSKEIAEKLNADERATDRLLNALCGIGYLVKSNGKFFNSEHAALYLVKGKPGYLGGLMHTVSLWDRWTTLTEVVKKGHAVYREAINDRGDDWLEAFIAAMNDRAKHQAKIIAMMLDLSNVNKTLDIGGGSGAFTFGFIHAKNDIHGTIFDLPNVIPITKKYVEAEKLTQQIDYITGDYLENDFGGPYDLILLSAIVHINSYDENKLLIKKCADVLNPGGQIAILDYVMSEDRTKPPDGARFALNMLVGTTNGDTYTEKEMTEWMNNAGITNVVKKETSFGSALMIGKKN